MGDDKDESGAKRAGMRFGWPGAVAVTALCAFAAFALHECSPVNQLSLAGQGLLKGAERLAEAINQQHVTETFREYLSSIKPDNAGRYLVAEGNQNVELISSDASVFGTTTAEIRVPATYRYYIALGEPWDLHVTISPSGVVNGDVVAPALRALPNPAMDTTRLEVKSQNGWGRWNKDEVQDELMKDLTVRLTANEMQDLPQYFPVAREAVEKFVKNWMLKEYGIPAGVPIYLKITFRNESPAGTPPIDAPSVQLFDANQLWQDGVVTPVRNMPLTPAP